MYLIARRNKCCKYSYLVSIRWVPMELMGYTISNPRAVWFAGQSRSGLLNDPFSRLAGKHPPNDRPPFAPLAERALLNSLSQRHGDAQTPEFHKGQRLPTSQHVSGACLPCN